ncbi:hypothetical protein ABIC08_007706 [Bradyrhizobium sp. RT9b]|uniref:hypothetical protein n=1 Tax=unclassified Bradyrhizobium TaxID=2631580 RepID=UPI00339B1996
MDYSALIGSAVVAALCFGGTNEQALKMGSNSYLPRLWRVRKTRVCIHAGVCVTDHEYSCLAHNKVSSGVWRHIVCGANWAKGDGFSLNSLGGGTFVIASAFLLAWVHAGAKRAIDSLYNRNAFSLFRHVHEFFTRFSSVK